MYADSQYRNLCVRVEIDRMPTMLKPYYSMRWLMSKGVFLRICRKVLRRLRLLPPAPSAAVAGRSLPPVDGVLGLSPGEFVEVKSREEIERTLDGYGRHDRLYFMAEQWQHCGRRSRVYKRVNRVLSEQTGRFRRARNVVLLEGVCCDGSRHGNCDASCFLFWKEAWLRRVGQ
jgi:hypothetical protein